MTAEEAARAMETLGDLVDSIPWAKRDALVRRMVARERAARAEALREAAYRLRNMGRQVGVEERSWIEIHADWLAARAEREE